jgi:hypothetical protein
MVIVDFVALAKAFLGIPIIAFFILVFKPSLKVSLK